MSYKFYEDLFQVAIVDFTVLQTKQFFCYMILSQTIFGYDKVIQMYYIPYCLTCSLFCNLMIQHHWKIMTWKRNRCIYQMFFLLIPFLAVRESWILQNLSFHKMGYATHCFSWIHYFCARSIWARTQHPFLSSVLQIQFSISLFAGCIATANVF